MIMNTITIVIWSVFQFINIMIEGSCKIIGKFSTIRIVRQSRHQAITTVTLPLSPTSNSNIGTTDITV